MKLSRAELKAKLMAEIEMKVDELLEWNAQHPKPTLTQIEDAVLKMRKQVGEAAANAVVTNQEAVSASERPICPTCGQAMQNKGYRENQIESRSGSLQTKRVYYYCPTCQTGTFPPG
jgi:hypothetical protein